MDEVGLGWIDRVEAAKDEQQQGWQSPSVLDSIVGRPLSQASCLASLGLAFRGRRRAILRVGSLQ